MDVWKTVEVSQLDVASLKFIIQVRA